MNAFFFVFFAFFPFVGKKISSPRRGDYCLSPEPEEIAKSLSLQLAEKQRNHQLTQENDRIAAEKHFNTWDSFWGRPGWFKHCRNYVIFLCFVL